MSKIDRINAELPAFRAKHNQRDRAQEISISDYSLVFEYVNITNNTINIRAQFIDDSANVMSINSDQQLMRELIDSMNERSNTIFNKTIERLNKQLKTAKESIVTEADIDD